MSYTQLKADVTAFSHRTDLDSLMDSFTALAESVINKDLRVIEMEKVLAFSYTAQFNDLPADYLLIRSIEITGNQGEKTTINSVTPEQLDSYTDSTTSVFCIQGGKLELFPVPDAATPLEGELVYYAKVPSLVSNATNDIQDNYPMLYLSAMMMQVHLYTQDEEINKWSAVYDEQVRQANKTSDDGRYHLPAMRVI